MHELSKRSAIWSFALGGAEELSVLATRREGTMFGVEQKLGAII